MKVAELIAELIDLEPTMPVLIQAANGQAYEAKTAEGFSLEHDPPNGDLDAKCLWVVPDQSKPIKLWVRVG